MFYPQTLKKMIDKNILQGLANLNLNQKFMQEFLIFDFHTCIEFLSDFNFCSKTIIGTINSNSI